MLNQAEIEFINIIIHNATNDSKELAKHYLQEHPEIRPNSTIPNNGLSIFNLAIVSGYFELVMEQMINHPSINVSEFDDIGKSNFEMALINHQTNSSAKLLLQAIIAHPTFKPELILQYKPTLRNSLIGLGIKVQAIEDSKVDFESIEDHVNVHQDPFEGVSLDETDGKIKQSKNSAFTKFTKK